MRPMYLPEVEQKNTGGAYARLIDGLRAAGRPVPQIMHLFAYKPDRTDFLSRFAKRPSSEEGERLVRYWEDLVDGQRFTCRPVGGEG